MTHRNSVQPAHQRQKLLEKNLFFGALLWQFLGRRIQTSTKLAHMHEEVKKDSFLHFFSLHFSSKKLKQVLSRK